MRPLVVFSGQGVARADGFNLTRRAKALPEFRTMLARMERSDRQNLDAILMTAVRSGAPSASWIASLRALCLKERRTTMRKVAHRGTFEAIAAEARRRVVVHLTANVDGLATTFLVRDFGARWAPFHGVAAVDRIRDEFLEVCTAGSGLVHFPLHGEVGLYVSESGGDRLRTAYHHPEVDDDGAVWVSSLVVGPGSGVDRIAKTMPASALALTIAGGLLRGGPVRLGGGVDAGPLPASDLVVLGYGAHERGPRSAHPFERMIRRIVDDGARDPSARWCSLQYGAAISKHVAAWHERNGLRIVSYEDGELPIRTAEAVESACSSPAGCEHRASTA
jgi:hypothetical protein